MALTGTAFLSFLAFLVVAATVTLVLLWSRLAVAAWYWYVARAGALITVNLLVLTTAAVALNDVFGFYADWTDLTGAIGGSPTQQATGSMVGVPPGDALAGAVASVHGRTVGSYAVAGMRDFTFKVHGPSGVTGTVLVEVPSNYYAKSQRRVTYPVIETMSGYPAAPSQWLDLMGLGSEVDHLVARGTLRPPIIVSPALEIPLGADTECVNAQPWDTQMETWLASDVPAWVDHTFRADRTRTSWATMGLSAGGYCAAMLTLRHPDVFGAAIVMGGYFQPTFSSSYVPFQPGSSLAKAYDMIAYAHKHAPPVAMWVEASHSDRYSITQTQRFLRAIRPPMSVRYVILKHAGHRFDTWRPLIPTALTWLAQSDPAFAKR